MEHDEGQLKLMENLRYFITFSAQGFFFIIVIRGTEFLKFAVKVIYEIDCHC